MIINILQQCVTEKYACPSTHLWQLCLREPREPWLTHLEWLTHGQMTLGQWALWEWLWCILQISIEHVNVIRLHAEASCTQRVIHIFEVKIMQLVTRKFRRNISNIIINTTVLELQAFPILYPESPVPQGVCSARTVISMLKYGSFHHHNYNRFVEWTPEVKC